MSRLGWLVLLACAALSGCAHPPPLPTVQSPPSSWQTAASSAEEVGLSWRLARPGDQLDKGAWWQRFEDPVLNGLVDRAVRDSPTLLVALARVRQARASAEVTGAALWPHLDLAGRSIRTRTSANRPANSSDVQALSSVQTDTVIQGVVSYELDLFGRLHLDQQSAQASAEQAEREAIHAQLILVADVVTGYFGVRSLDEEVVVLTQTLAIQRRALMLLQARHEGGVASGLDVVQQQAQLDANQTQLTLLNKQREGLVHALATLTGSPANAFQLAPGHLPSAMPIVPVALPSEVLLSRPDVAAAARAVAAANAQLGLAQAAWYPSLVLTGGAGWESKRWASLLDGPSVLWALGGSVAQAVFDGGRNQARTDQAAAARDAAAQNYQSTVLRAMQEVEDGLSGLNALATARAQSQAAIGSAGKVLDIANERYAGGVITYLDVVTAQQNLLSNQRQAAQLKAQQLQSTAYLIKALGGGWGEPAYSSAISFLGAEQGPR